MPFAFNEHPVEQFRRHVWVAPYYEDDMALLKDALGIDRLLFGSDFPHTEGLPEPTMFVKDIPTFTPPRTPARSCGTTCSTCSDSPRSATDEVDVAVGRRSLGPLT